MTLYYDFRNALNYFGKHSSGAPKLNTYLNVLGSYLSSFFYLRLLGKRTLAVYLGDACRDFFAGRFGRADIGPAELRESPAAAISVPVGSLASCSRVILFAVGSYDEIVSTVAAIKAHSPRASLAIAVAADRAEAYRLPDVDRLIVYDLLKDGLVGRLRTIRALLTGRFSYGVTAGKGFTVPYAFLLSRNYNFEHDGSLSYSMVSWKGVWKLPTALLLGKFCALLLLLPALNTARHRLKLKKESS